jgi:hypothetical protein
LGKLQFASLFPSLTFFSGNGGSKFRKKLKKFLEMIHTPALLRFGFPQMNFYGLSDSLATITRQPNQCPHCHNILPIYEVGESEDGLPSFKWNGSSHLILHGLKKLSEPSSSKRSRPRSH